MATPSFSLEAEEDLTCPVCFELLKDPNTPKLLDCPHVCCAVCIEKLIEGERKFVDCPECRHITRIPEDGVDAMKTVLRVRSLAEKHEENITKKSRSCTQHHISIDYYCKKCNIAGCSTCMMKNHQGIYHDNVDIQTIRESQNAQMDVVIERVTNNIEKCKTTLQQLETLKTQAEEYLSAQQKSIEKRGEEAVMKVQQEVKAISESLQKEEQRRINHIDEEMKRLSAQIQKSENTLTTVRSTIETSEPHDLVTQHAELEHNVKVLGDNKTETGIDFNPVVKMTKVVYSGPMTEAFGTLLQVRKIQCELVTEFGDFQYAICVTATLSGLLVISDYDAKQVHIYSQQKNGQYKKQSTLSLSSKNTTIKPCSVAVMADGRYLVARMSHLEVYSPSRKYEGVLDIKYSLSTGAKDINSVSLMPDGRVLVGDFNNSLLFILKENITSRKFKTSIRPGRVTIMSNGRVALSDWKKGKVCVIDVEVGKELEMIDIPYAQALCYHEKTDCLIVGRCEDRDKDGFAKPGSGVLEQYCATTSVLVERLATKLHRPQYTTFTPSGQLVLADTKTVKIFKIQVF